jgi:hypothetical protein
LLIARVALQVQAQRVAKRVDYYFFPIYEIAYYFIQYKIYIINNG